MDLSLLLCSFLCAFLLSLGDVQGTTTDGQRSDAQSKAADIASSLFVTLRNIAFSEHKLKDNTKVDSRFLLLMPGKVLNYFDYYPGDEYKNFIQVRIIIYVYNC